MYCDQSFDDGQERTACTFLVHFNDIDRDCHGELGGHQTKLLIYILGLL